MLEETVIVIMIKDRYTGFLEKELTSCAVSEHDELLLNAFAYEAEGGIKIVLRLTCEKDVSDWEFHAIFDYYDESVYDSLGVVCAEAEDCENPTWELSFDYDEAGLPEKLNSLLKLHANELAEVYEAVKDLESEYTGN